MIFIRIFLTTFVFFFFRGWGRGHISLHRIRSMFGALVYVIFLLFDGTKVLRVALLLIKRFKLQVSVFGELFEYCFDIRRPWFY